MTFHENSLLRCVTFHENSLLQCVTFHENSLLQCVTFHENSLLHCVTSHENSLLQCVTFHENSLLQCVTSLEFLISNYRCVLNVVFFLLGDCLTSEFYVPVSWNPVYSLFVDGVSRKKKWDKIARVFIQVKVWLKIT